MVPKSSAAEVEVVYATAKEQRIVTLPFAPGMTAGEAVELSRLLSDFPEIRSLSYVLGIFGARIEPERALHPGDRVEICRPLEIDPRVMRRMLAAGGKVMGGVKKQAPE